MSGDQTPDPAQDVQMSTADVPTKASHKSYRRKYRKIMVKFEEKMRDSTALFKDEQRILDISRRLAEQNDQLLELLHDLNSCPQIPSRLRYDLRPPETHFQRNETVATSHDYSVSTAQTALQAARTDLQNGHVSAADYRQIEDDILTSPEFAAKRSYASLSEVPHSHPITSIDTNPDAEAVSGDLLSAHQEEEYLQGLDSYIAGVSTSARPHAANNLGARNAEKSVEREKELQLRNPVSVYNWLRKHQPQVFLQDNESHPEKPKATSARVSKRAPMAIKQEPELYDDEGIAVDMGGLRGKRKRDDDGGYRPKGGNSRPSKRKKEDFAGSATKKTKKLSVSELAG